MTPRRVPAALRNLDYFPNNKNGDLGRNWVTGRSKPEFRTLDGNIREQMERCYNSAGYDFALTCLGLGEEKKGFK
jgi:hypothetical protein